MKKIVHFQIPTIKNNGTYSCAFQNEFIQKIVDEVQKKLGKKYIVIATPFKISASKNVDIINLGECSEEDFNKFLDDNCVSLFVGDVKKFFNF